MIIKDSYSDQIYEQIKQDIVYHRVSPGEKLINRELQKRFGVSSTPVRDAINRLYLDGFVEEITKAGAKVINFNQEFALEINEIISSLSDHAIKMSAEKSNVDEVASVLAHYLEMQKMNLNNDEYFKYDNEYHLTFFRYSKNKRFADLYQRYNIFQEIMIRYTYLYNKVNDFQKELAIKQHEAIYQAYKARNIDAARNTMEKHYSYAVAQIQAGFPTEKM